MRYNCFLKLLQILLESDTIFCMNVKKITRKQAYEYLSKIGILGVAMDGFLYANPDVTDIYSNDKLDGLLITKGKFTQLHSLNANFLSDAYDFVGEDAFFNCVDYNTASILQSQKNAICFSYCHIYGYLNAIEDENKFAPPKGLKLKQIDLKDLDVINDYYTYKSPTSRQRLEHEIKSRASSALYDGDKIVAWNLLHDDHSMGVMFVPPQHRQKGYAQVVAFDLLKQVIKSGKIPYVQIVDGNTPSICLAKKLGFEHIFDACWLSKKEKIK